MRLVLWKGKSERTKGMYVLMEYDQKLVMGETYTRSVTPLLMKDPNNHSWGGGEWIWYDTWTKVVFPVLDEKWMEWEDNQNPVGVDWQKHWEVTEQEIVVNQEVEDGIR